MIRTYWPKRHRRKATEKEMLLCMARKDDLKRVLRHGVRVGGDGRPRTELTSPTRAAGMLHTAPRDHAWWPARIQVVWAQQGGSQQWGLAEDTLVLVACHMPLPPKKVHNSSVNRH